MDELVRSNADLRVYRGIGEALNGALREIVLTGTLASLEKLRSKSSPELVAISTHPRRDPKRILRIYKKLGMARKARKFYAVIAIAIVVGLALDFPDFTR